MPEQAQPSCSLTSWPLPPRDSHPPGKQDNDSPTGTRRNTLDSLVAPTSLADSREYIPKDNPLEHTDRHMERLAREDSFDSTPGQQWVSQLQSVGIPPERSAGPGGRKRSVASKTNPTTTPAPPEKPGIGDETPRGRPPYRKWLVVDNGRRSTQPGNLPGLYLSRKCQILSMRDLPVA